jgi:3-hydroxyisobutyrate dehydrogenase-like beta-hydroxyacid dehydrogenase
MRVAVLGLGEAGGRIAADLVTAGVEVRGWDPVRESSAASGADAVDGADVVLSLTTAAHALEAARSVASALGDALYADLNTASPGLKRELAGVVPHFVDVGLMGTVTGIGTPALASGPGAARFAELFRPLGMPVEIVDDAAGTKLLRSVFMKGIAAAALESLEAAEAAGEVERIRAEIVAVLGEPLLDRLLEGSHTHAARRVDEMRAAVAYLDELGVPPRVATAAAEWLEQMRALS